MYTKTENQNWKHDRNPKNAKPRYVKKKHEYRGGEEREQLDLFVPARSTL